MERHLDTELFVGDDLARSVELSRAEWPESLARETSWRMPDLSEWRYARHRLAGIDRSGGSLSVEFVGVERSRPYFVSHLFARGATERVQGKCDLRITDFPLPLPSVRPLVRCLTPVWVHQTVALGDSWPGYLQRLGRKRRRDTARLLRRLGPAVTLSQGHEALERFFHDLYRPFAESRFAARAALLKWPAFEARFRNAVILALRTASGERAANLLVRESEQRLSIAKGGQSDGGAAVPGMTDLTDYFTLVYAATLGCTEVGFGASHGHLDDGPLRYKAKWLAALDPPSRLKRPARIDVLRDTPAARRFLENNRFLQADRRGYFVRTMAPVDPDPPERALANKLGLVAHRGDETAPASGLAAEYARRPTLGAVSP